MTQNKRTTLKLACTIAAAFCLAACLLLATGCAKQEETQNTSSSDTNLNVSEKTANTTTTTEVSLDPTYILIIGNDHWEDYYPTDRSDLMLLARVDFKNGVMDLISIPRDTKYTWDDGTVTKANEAYAQEGAEGALKAVKQITGIDVKNYVDIGFDGLEAIVEQFGGLQIDLPYSITYSFYTKDHDDESFNAGEQTLTGWQAMVISRARTGYKQYGFNQDMMRQVVDRQMFINLMKAALTDKTKAAELVVSLMPNVSTNIDAATMKAWVSAITANDTLTVYGNSGPVNGAIDSDSGLWLCYENPEAWSTLMSLVDSGEDPTTFDANTDVEESDIAPIRSTVTIDLS